MQFIKGLLRKCKYKLIRHDKWINCLTFEGIPKNINRVIALVKRMSTSLRNKHIVQSTMFHFIQLRHLSQMEFPNTCIINQSIFVSRVVKLYFHIYQNADRTFCKQTVETLIRHRILRCLIWVCTVCLCPTKKTLGLKGLACSTQVTSFYLQAKCKTDRP